MNDLLLPFLERLARHLPLDLGQAERLTDHLLAPLNAIFTRAASLLDLPFVGPALVPVYVVFAIVGGAIGALVTVGLLVASALASAASAEVVTQMTDAIALFSTLRHALGGW